MIDFLHAFGRGLVYASAAAFLGLTAHALVTLAKSIVSYRRWKKKLRREHFANKAHMDDKR